jgi:hypothetical protein
LYGASLVPGMTNLDISGQAFTGALANTSFQFPMLQSLNLANNYLTARAYPSSSSACLSSGSAPALPALWGTAGLQVLHQVLQ